MTLSCYCYDFDKSDYDNWWEPGGRCVPPKGRRCCECGAPLPAGIQCASFDHMEVWEPEGSPPPHPEDLPDTEYEALSQAEATVMEDARDATERYERCIGADYRCERCEDLAESIEALGYCMIAPGDLISAHLEFIHEHHYAERKWVQNKDGVLNPVPWNRRDYFRDWRRKKWNSLSWKTKLFYWKWRGRIKRMVMA